MDIKKIGVVGAGKMGNGIVLTAAMSGFDVILQNRTEANLVKAINGMEKQYERLVEKGILTEEKSAAAQARIQTTSTFEGYDSVDFVIEVVAESMELKTAILAKLNEICKKEAYFVSGTSAFSITTLGEATQRPEQFAGMHFFIPPTKLIEITRGYYTSDDTVSHARAVAEKMGRIPVVVKKDSPGFIANRIYTPLMLEAFRAYEEGVASKEDIDLAMKNTYLPIGPFELADIIGLDVLKSGLDYFKEELGPQWNAPQSMRQLLRAGRLGKKTGKGWYNY